MSRLSIRNVSKSYFSRKKSLLALSSANLDIGEGEFICLVGPSGCGKTTLLNMIAGLIKSDTGSISYFVFEFLHYRMHRLARSTPGCKEIN